MSCFKHALHIFPPLLVNWVVAMVRNSCICSFAPEMLPTDQQSHWNVSDILSSGQRCSKERPWNMVLARSRCETMEVEERVNSCQNIFLETPQNFKRYSNISIKYTWNPPQSSRPYILFPLVVLPFPVPKKWPQKYLDQSQLEVKDVQRKNLPFSRAHIVSLPHRKTNQSSEAW